jgi:AraC-like DNA-binding protein
VIVQRPIEDALSAVLRSVNAEALCSIRLQAGGRWAVDFPMPSALKFNVVQRGGCWLITNGHEPVRLEPGDCVIVAGARFELASELGLRAVPARDVFADDMSGTVGEGDEFSILGGSVHLDTIDGVVVSGALPPLLVIKGAEVPQVRWLLEQLDREWSSPAPGARLVCNDLLRLIFIHVLRVAIAREDASVGWLAGLADRHLSPVLHAIHANPAEPWTLAKLARIAGQSRSGFASHFRERVGTAPIEYLTAWRMRLAAARLRRDDQPIATVGRELGYATDSAFTACFRRVIGRTPKQYRREMSVTRAVMLEDAHGGVAS